MGEAAETDGSRLALTFWGVRGSTPTPRQDCLGFGGNTSCLEITAGGQRIVIDAGSGVRELGDRLVEEARGSKLRVDLLLTHFHWDHIQGLPFFAPLFRSDAHVAFHSGRGAASMKETLEGQMARPYFPVPFEAVAARRDFHNVAGEAFSVGSIKILPFPVNHPQGASGYRIQVDGASIVHVTDHEHGDKAIDFGIRDYAAGADALIYDAQYTPEEYGSKRGWGHSTYAEAARVARDSGAKRLILFHHDPHHNDEFLSGMLSEARRLFDNTELAREGETIRF